MMIRFIAQNKDIPKDLLINQKIIDVDFLGSTTVFYLENGCDFYFHNDNGEMEILKVEED